MFLRFVLLGLSLLVLVPGRAAEGTPNSIGLMLVPVPAGHFVMGQALRQTSYTAPWSAAKDRGADWDETPVHEVEISHPFLISATEVTNAQYEKFDPSHARRGRPGGRVQSGEDGAVVNVSWDDALAFCRWLSAKEGRNYRLPTEAEWEYACRAGTTTLFNTGDVLPDGYLQVEPGTFMAFAYYFPHPEKLPPYYRLVKTISLRVGQRAPNAWGLFDMGGLVWEWCADWYAPYDGTAARDPLGPASGDFRVIRGGCYSNFARLVRSANRASMEPWTRNRDIGFRVVQADPLPVMTADEPAAAPETAAANPPARDASYSPDAPYFQGPVRYENIPPGSKGPLFSQHDHDTALTACPNGDLLALWYTTEEETGPELNVAMSGLPSGAEAWTPPALFWSCADANNHAPAIFTNADGTIFHFNGNKAMPGSVVRISKDNGRTWTRAVPFSTYTQPNEANIHTRDGRILATLDGDLYSGVVVQSTDAGATWRQLTNEHPRPDFTPGKTGTAIAGLHVGLVERKDGSLFALGRFDKPADEARFHGHIPVSISTDGGRTWTYRESPLPGVSWGQRFTLKRLHEGPLLLCSFTDSWAIKNEAGAVIGRKTAATVTGMTFRRPDGKKVAGFGMYAAVSFDDGATWPVRRLIVPKGGDARLGLDETHAERDSYLSSCQTADGKIHVISDRNCYTFNLAWLTEGTSFAPAGH